MIREEVQWGFMNLQDVLYLMNRFTVCFGGVWRRIGRIQRGRPDITLDGTKEDYEKLRKQYPHLSIEECEYSCAGAEFYMKLLKHQGFMIHASAVEKEGKAYLFSAPSGTGKSTHAQLWRQTFKGEPIRIINDDKPAVCLQNGVFYACGTPFSGKTDKNENRKAPIQGLCIFA